MIKYEKLMNLPQQHGGFLLATELNQVLLTAKKTGFGIEKLAIGKQAGNVLWADNKVTLSWNGQHRYLPPDPTGTKIYRNGRVFIDLTKLKSTASNLVAIQGYIIGCAHKSGVIVVAVFGVASLLIVFLNGATVRGIGSIDVGSVDNAAPIQTAVFNVDVNECSVLLHNDNYNVDVVIAIDVVNFTATKKSLTNYELVNKRVGNGFQSDKILCAVDYENNTRKEVTAEVFYTEHTENTVITNEASPAKFKWNSQKNYCFASDGTYSDETMWTYGYYNSLPNPGTGSYPYSSKYTHYSGVTQMINYSDTTTISNYSVNVAITLNLPTGSLKIHSKSATTTITTRAVSDSSEVFYAGVDNPRNVTPDQGISQSTLPVTNSGTSSSSSTQSSSTNAYLTFLTDLDLRHGLISSTKFVLDGASTSTIKIGGATVKTVANPLPTDFSIWHDWFLRVFDYSAYYSPFFTFFAVPDPNFPGRTQKYSRLIPADFTCFDKFQNLMMSARIPTGLNQEKLKSGTFEFTHPGFNAAPTIYKQASSAATDTTFTETAYKNLVGVI